MSLFRLFILCSIASYSLEGEYTKVQRSPSRLNEKKLFHFDDDGDEEISSSEESQLFSYICLAILSLCASYAAYCSRYEIGSCVFGGEIFLRNRVQVGNSECLGREIVLSNEVKIKQLLVKNQHDHDGGGYASCGYHALKNHLLIAYALRNQKNNLQSLLTDSAHIQTLFSDNGNWRVDVIGNRRGQGNGEWLQSNEIEQLITHEKNNNIFINGIDPLSQNQNNDSRIDFCVIDDIRNLGNNGFDHVSGKVRELLGYSPAYAGIIPGTMQQNDDDNTAKGHWIGIGIYQNAPGKRTYIVHDSTNHPRFHGDERIARMLEVFESREVADQFRNQ